MDVIDLREKAKHCRELGRATESPNVIEQLLQWAEDYEEEARAMEQAADYNAVDR